MLVETLLVLLLTNQKFLARNMSIHIIMALLVIDIKEMMTKKEFIE